MEEKCIPIKADGKALRQSTCSKLGKNCSFMPESLAEICKVQEE